MMQIKEKINTVQVLKSLLSREEAELKTLKQEFLEKEKEKMVVVKTTTDLNFDKGFNTLYLIIKPLDRESLALLSRDSSEWDGEDDVAFEYIESSLLELWTEEF